MTTLYIRDVPSEVTEQLKARAAAEGASLSAYVARELTKLASRPSNAEVASRLSERDRAGGPESADILTAVRQARR